MIIEVSYCLISGMPFSFFQLFVLEIHRSYPYPLSALVRGLVEGKFETDTAATIVQEIILRFS
jgi:hypothetical protein